MTSSAHEEITRRLHEYAYGVDTRDWELYRSIFRDDIDVDFSSYNGRAAGRVAADDWVAGVRPLFTGLDATQHAMTNPLVDVADDRARCRMYVQAMHFLHDWPEPEFTLGGYYDDALTYDETGWRITSVKLTVWWRRGDQAMMAEAARRGARRLEDVTDAG